VIGGEDRRPVVEQYLAARVAGRVAGGLRLARHAAVDLVRVARAEIESRVAGGAPIQGEGPRQHRLRLLRLGVPVRIELAPERGGHVVLETDEVHDAQAVRSAPDLDLSAHAQRSDLVGTVAARAPERSDRLAADGQPAPRRSQHPPGDLDRPRRLEHQHAQHRHVGVRRRGDAQGSQREAPREPAARCGGSSQDAFLVRGRVGGFA
jgi:hypothetical protein